MQVAPAAAEHPRIRDFLDDCVVEDKVGAVVEGNAVEKTTLHELGHDVGPRGHARLDRHEQRQAEAASDHRRCLQDTGAFRRKQIDACRHGSLDRGRDSRFIPPPLHTPDTCVKGQHVGLLQRAHDLLDEKRIAAGAVKERLCKAVGERTRQQRGEQLVDRVRIERLERDPRVVPLSRVEPVHTHQCVRSARCIDENVVRRRGARELGRQCERGRVDPVQILDRQHDRLCRRGSRQPADERVVQATTERLWLELCDPFETVERKPEQAGEERQRVVGSFGRKESLQTLAYGWRILVRPRAAQAAQQRGVRPVRERVSVRQAARLEPAKPARGGHGPNLARQARLADAGFADDRQHGAVSRLGGGECALCGCELLATADERRCAAFVGIELRPAALAKESPRRHGLALAFQGQVPDPGKVEVLPCQAERRLADVCLTGRRGRLETLGEDDGVAEDPVVHPRFAAEDACDPVAGIDAHVQGEVSLVRERRTDARELAMHFERDEERA